MFELIVATQNTHKLDEIRPLLSNRPVQLKSLADFDTIPEIIEDGQTFEENAAIKAEICFKQFKQAVFADDSGLEVPALNNEPGIFSARYAGEHANHQANNLLLLKNMKHLSGPQRAARFVSTICYMDENGTYFFTGIAEGLILEHLQGRKGFGYDPLFFLPELNKTFAELSLEEKNRYSHRGKSVRKFIDFLDNRILKKS